MLLTNAHHGLVLHFIFESSQLKSVRVFNLRGQIAGLADVTSSEE